MRRIAVAALLGAASTAWSALPLTGTGAPGVLLVVVAGACVLAGVVRLLAHPAASRSRFSMAFWALLGTSGPTLRRAGPESVAAVSMVALEALHHSRPWHTGLMALVLVSYLLAVHEAESPVPAALWRQDARLLVVSVPLVVVATGVAMVPTAGSGATSEWLEIIAALAAISAGALALPV